MMDDDAMTSLENDIKANGQSSPVVVWNGQIVDGRNRYAACTRSRIKPKVKAVEFANDAECVRFIISNNIHRRHLSADQRRILAAKLVTLQAGNPDLQSPQIAGIGVAAAAAAVHVDEAGVERARTVLKRDPALAEQVLAGKISVAAAAKKLAKPKAAKPVPIVRAAQACRPAGCRVAAPQTLILDRTHRPDVPEPCDAVHAAGQPVGEVLS
jgi:hypothetical protein